mmetsp:Transcript_17414/g.54030  ORF Transcript_17414/g.54030 Transcript_17414/m.54030 type:complete len:585 (-) Transcript_17414:819-2573(-)
MVALTCVRMVEIWLCTFGTFTSRFSRLSVDPTAQKASGKPIVWLCDARCSVSRKSASRHISILYAFVRACAFLTRIENCRSSRSAALAAAAVAADSSADVGALRMRIRYVDTGMYTPERDEMWLSISMTCRCIGNMRGDEKRSSSPVAICTTGWMSGPSWFGSWYVDTSRPQHRSALRNCQLNTARTLCCDCSCSAARRWTASWRMYTYACWYAASMSVAYRFTTEVIRKPMTGRVWIVYLCDVRTSDRKMPLNTADWYCDRVPAARFAMPSTTMYAARRVVSSACVHRLSTARSTTLVTPRIRWITRTKLAMHCAICAHRLPSALDSVITATDAFTTRFTSARQLLSRNVGVLPGAIRFGSCAAVSFAACAIAYLIRSGWSNFRVEAGVRDSCTLMPSWRTAEDMRFTASTTFFPLIASSISARVTRCAVRSSFIRADSPALAPPSSSSSSSSSSSLDMPPPYMPPMPPPPPPPPKPPELLPAGAPPRGPASDVGGRTRPEAARGRCATSPPPRPPPPPKSAAKTFDPSSGTVSPRSTLSSSLRSFSRMMRSLVSCSLSISSSTLLNLASSDSRYSRLRYCSR